MRLVDMLCRPGDLTRTLRRFRPDVVGVTTEAVRFGPALAVLRRIRRLVPDCLTVVGGHHPTDFPEEFEDPAVDLIVLGEGVEAFRETCQTRAAGGRSFRHIPGLMIRTSNGLEATEPRPMPPDLDSQPLPDRWLTARYRRHYYYITEPSAAGMRTSFGCKFHCSFCPNPLYCGGHFVVRDPKRMFEEICSIREPFIYFCDNGSFHDVERMEALGHMLLKAGVKKRYLTYVRADTIVQNPELFRLWARVGLTIAMIGLEALDEASLCRFQKGTSTSENEQAVRFLEEIGVAISGGFVVEPTAAPEDFQRMDQYIRNHPSILHCEFTPLTPFPGTPYYERQKENILSRDWELYDMQHFVVNTRLPAQELYRMMVRSYRRVVFRAMRREKLWIPLWGIRKRKIRLLRGLLANGAALSRAHRHLKASELAGPHLRRSAGSSAGLPAPGR